MDYENMNYENKTHLFFNNDFKEFIIKLKQENECLLLETSYNLTSYVRLQDIQNWIRIWVVDNQLSLKKCWSNHIIKNNCAHSMSDFFVIFISILVDDLEKCFSWDDIFLRFEKYKDYNITLEFKLTDFEENLDTEGSKCLCSQHCYVQNMSKITNTKNNITFWIGCICCNKTGIITKTEFEKKVRNARSQVMENYNTKKEFKRIEKLKLKALEIKKQQELKLAEKYKKCINCLEYKILLSEPEWKKTCGRCFYEKENAKKVTGVCLLKIKK